MRTRYQFRNIFSRAYGSHRVRGLAPALVATALFGLTGFCALSFGTAAAQDIPQGRTIARRGVTWGASADAITQSEGGPASQTTNSGAMTLLVYPGQLASEPVSVVYRLLQGKLVEIDYHLETRGRGCVALSERYQQIVSTLTSELGPPTRAETGANAKQCSATTEWSSADVLVSANLTTDSGRTDVAVSSVSPQLGGLATSVTTVPRTR